MLHEVQSAASFITSLAKNLSAKNSEILYNSLCRSMYLYYKDHWFPEKPNKGSAYRCIQVSSMCADPIIESALRHCNFSNTVPLFKCHVTVWVDPKEVSYRIGEDGSIGVHYKEPESNQLNNILLSRCYDQSSNILQTSLQNIAVNA